MIPQTEPVNATSVNETPAVAGVALRIGTRGSALARRQAEAVVEFLARRYPTSPVQTIIVRTEGDLDKQSPLTLIGGRGVFTSALQSALLERHIDAAVHSAKDLPSLTPPEITIAAYPERADPRDVVVSRHGVGLADLPPHPTIGTSSRRRAALVRAARTDARIVELRGNIDTRLQKALASDLDAVILAAAGVARMGWDERVTSYLPISEFTPAPGQGALAVETRQAPDPAAAMLHAINDPTLAAAVAIERAFLRGVGGGCTTPLGAHAAFELANNGQSPLIRFHAMLASDDGARLERVTELLAPERGEEAAFDLARRLMRAVRPRFHLGVPGPTAPLDGLTVLVTRAPERAGGLVAAVEAAGALPVVLPTIAIAPVKDGAMLAAAARRLAAGGFDWVAFTSANAVEPLVRHLEPVEVGKQRFKVAAVGPSTVSKLAEQGLRTDLVPTDASASALVTALPAELIKGKRILCPQGDRARPTLVEGLRAAGAVVETVEAYRTLPASATQPTVQRLAHEGRIDVVTFASPSAVDGFLAAVGDELAALSGACFVCIGPTTAAAARARGLPVHAVAEEQSDAGIVAAILRYFGARPAGVDESEGEDG